MIKRLVLHRPVTLLAFVSLSLSACAFFEKDSDPKPAYAISIGYDAGNPVTKLPTDQGRLRVTVTGLSGESVFLVKCNGSPYDAAEGTTGMIDEGTVDRSVARAADSALPGAFALNAGRPRAGAVSTGGVIRREHPLASSFTLPPSGRSREVAALTVAEQLAKPPAGHVPYAKTDVGTAKKAFYVENSSYKWKATSATLRGFGDHCLVWVADENYNASGGEGVSDESVSGIVTSFDKLYYPETALLGHEYGGGVSPTDASYGGADGEARVNIFVYDIEYDYDGTSTQDSGIVGYFWAKDLFPQDVSPSALVGTSSSVETVSNVGEIFYIDAHFLHEYADFTYVTLAHEFQHMINFNRKNARLNIADDVPTWYNEMLSLMAEDALAPLLGIDSSSDAAPAERMRLFNYYYPMGGLTYWDPDYAGYYSYPFAYAFGAYLARNYGGARLLESLLANDSVGVDSVNSALSSVGSAADFPTAFQKFGESLVFGSGSPSSVNSFYREPASYKIALPNGECTFTYSGIDLWNYDYDVEGETYRGPWVCRSGEYPIKEYGVFVDSVYDLQKVYDSVTFDVVPPSDPDVSTYIMIND